MNTPTLESAIEASHKALAAIVKGDQGGYLALFSGADDVTLGNPFGPFGRGRKNVEDRLAIAASKYRDGRNVSVVLIEQYVSESLVCVVEVESAEAKIAGGEEMTRVSVRVTSIFRLEAGDWKLVHRHADPLSIPQCFVSAPSRWEAEMLARHLEDAVQPNPSIERTLGRSCTASEHQTLSEVKTMKRLPKGLNETLVRSLPDEGPVVMVNLVRFRERSLDGDGSGWDAYVRYSKGDMPLLRKVGGTVVWAGHVEGIALGELGGGRWDWVVLANYPSRAAFLEMMTSDEYAKINVDRENGVEDHVILAASQTYSKVAAAPKVAQ